ncbi:UNVERIFIED_CONTAM: hypothetical protein Sangu_0182800 [Sesamum angustifolium]|uniref:CCHC-type domain-containing protein n=1 Tax=Sesamum angustifolium TaxID=2727405 RepID=A0AAW2RLP7_9LAMI
MADQGGISIRWEAMEASTSAEELIVGLMLLRRKLSGSKIGGERSAKELENFLWDMETYFRQRECRIRRGIYHKHVSHGDAKLWWRSRLSDDASANRERIETWEFSHVGREGYVRGGQVFNFMAGLKPWAQTELRRQGVKDLPTAIAAADRLGDYKVPNEPEQRSDDSGDGKAKFGKKFKKKDKVKEVMTETSEPRSVERPRAGCFICGNLEHRARDCPKRGRLNAIVAEHTDTNRRLVQLG